MRLTAFSFVGAVAVYKGLLYLIYHVPFFSLKFWPGASPLSGWALPGSPSYAQGAPVAMGQTSGATHGNPYYDEGDTD